MARRTARKDDSEPLAGLALAIGLLLALYLGTVLFGSWLANLLAGD